MINSYISYTVQSSFTQRQPKMSSDKVKQLIEQTFSDPFVPAHQKGPDYIIPTEEFRTWLPEGATKIELLEENDDKKPMSIVTFFRKIVEEFPNHHALKIKRNEEWQSWTYEQYWDQLGLIPFHGVGILGCNAPEWFFSHLATIFSGGFTAGIYTTNSADACYHVLNDCEANIAVVENELQLDKILKIRDKLPNLKAIVQFTGIPTHPDVISWDDLLQIGLSVSDDILEKRIKGLAVNQCCTLIYTSGTTGNPKGVMISHDNMVYEVTYFSKYGLGSSVKGEGSCVSYLPLSHIAALGNLVETLSTAKPIGFLGVPRVFEKIYEKIRHEELNMNFIKRYLFLWARNQAAKYHALKPTHEPIAFTLSNKLVLNKVKHMMGLHRARTVFCGGAPLSKEVHQYFTELNITIIEGYGLSESCGIHIMNDKNDIKIGAVGNVTYCPECEIKLHNVDESGGGEILLRGRNVCMGYLKLQDKTIETIDDERWLHTGDTGTIDKFGLLRITGRIKEIIITSGGENIPPLIIEEEIKKCLPAVSNCILIGDRKKYLTMLITLKTELNMDTLLPTDQLSLPALKWCKEIGSSATTVSKIIEENDQNVKSAIQSAVDKYNKEKAISSAQKIQKWTILPVDFNIPSGELGPTAKLRRPFIVEKYSEEIDKMYSS
uniref:long-chain-fatty-acid--CoA ligase n=1 Tax=Strigamia maritima TaxID=126957 RepID=T1IJB7_STRMM